MKCLEGCDRKEIQLKTPGPVRVMTPSKRRGEPGHVDDCACAPCQIRRRAKFAVFRDRFGLDIGRVYWNGADNDIEWHAQSTGTIRHWYLTDDNGDVVAGGTADLCVTRGQRIKTCIATSMAGSDTVALSVAPNLLDSNDIELDEDGDLKTRDGWANLLTGLSCRSLLEEMLAYPTGGDDRPETDEALLRRLRGAMPQPFTEHNIAEIALLVDYVEEVELRTPAPFTVEVHIKKMNLGLSPHGRYLVASEVYNALWAGTPAGFAFCVTWEGGSIQ